MHTVHIYCARSILSRERRLRQTITLPLAALYLLWYKEVPDDLSKHARQALGRYDPCSTVK